MWRSTDGSSGQLIYWTNASLNVTGQGRMSAIQRIRQKILNKDYYISWHAEEEMMMMII
jgi:hypothetical protein